MSPSEVKLRSVVAQVLELSPDAVSDETSMETVAMWDSLKHLHLVLALEEQFGISFDEMRALEIVSIPLIRSALSELGIQF